VGRLVVIEGLDGAGKRTLADGLVCALSARGASVARMAFPRYDLDVHAELARDALYGRLGDLASSVHGMAVLFALDRRAAAEQLRTLRCGHDVVLLDRYVACTRTRRARSSNGSVAWKSTGSASRCRISNCCCGCRSASPLPVRTVGPTRTARGRRTCMRPIMGCRRGAQPSMMV
jgi:hypothetical protein